MQHSCSGLPHERSRSYFTVLVSLCQEVDGSLCVVGGFVHFTKNVPHLEALAPNYRLF